MFVAVAVFLQRGYGEDGDGHLTRVQVKSTTVRNGTGYFVPSSPISNYLYEKVLLSRQTDLFARLHHPRKCLVHDFPAVSNPDPHNLGTRVTILPVTTLKKNHYRYRTFTAKPGTC